MNLIAFALCCVPNVAAARRLYDVEGLDDDGVAKIMYHRRKQQNGRNDLRPDQQRIALLSLVHGEPEHPQLVTLSTASDDEATILRHLGEALGGTGRLAGWRLGAELAVLRLRATHLGVALPRLWHDEHVDLAANWGGETPLGEAARLMGLPGLGDTECADIWEAWHGGDHDAVQACAELRALNTWQLSHKVAVAQGRLTPIHARNGIQALRKKLAVSASEHLRTFAERLEG